MLKKIAKVKHFLTSDKEYELRINEFLTKVDDLVDIKYASNGTCYIIAVIYKVYV